MNLQQFYAKALKRYFENSHERYGQAHMNLLSEINPELARSVTNTPNDPFYSDLKMENFRKWLACVWEDVADQED